MLYNYNYPCSKTFASQYISSLSVFWRIGRNLLKIFCMHHCMNIVSPHARVNLGTNVMIALGKCCDSPWEKWCCHWDVVKMDLWLGKVVAVGMCFNWLGFGKFIAVGMFSDWLGSEKCQSLLLLGRSVRNSVMKYVINMESYYYWFVSMVELFT